jgi:hypothetical protein
MTDFKQKLTLAQPAKYQIKVPGELDENWAEWVGTIKVVVGCDDDGLPVSTLTGTFDQAALHGLLRRLYALGLPLISVVCIEVE